MSRLESVVEQLREEEVRLITSREKLEQQLKAVDTDVRRVQAALVALGEKPTSKSAKKPAAKLAANKQQISNLVAEVLRANEALETDALRLAVEGRLKDKGLSRVGFASRFSEVLREDQFVESPAGWKLVSETPACVEQAVDHQPV
jgi:hypothetical protein